MGRNFYAEINLHITWHTKDSAPLLVPQVEAVVHHYVRGRCMNTPGVFVHEIGGIETHVHLAVSIAPTVLISEFIGQLKGSSSHEASQKLGRKVLEWQTGYGVVSFGTRDLKLGNPPSTAGLHRCAESPVNRATDRPLPVLVVNSQKNAEIALVQTHRPRSQSRLYLGRRARRRGP